MILPHAIGCPSCPHYEVVSVEDPVATQDEMFRHVRSEHADYDQAAAYELLKQAQGLTEEQVNAR